MSPRNPQIVLRTLSTLLNIIVLTIAVAFVITATAVLPMPSKRSWRWNGEISVLGLVQEKLEEHFLKFRLLLQVVLFLCGQNFGGYTARNCATAYEIVGPVALPAVPAGRHPEQFFKIVFVAVGFVVVVVAIVVVNIMIGPLVVVVAVAAAAIRTGTERQAQSSFGADNRDGDETGLHSS